MPVAMEIPGTYTPPPHKLWTREECAAMERAGLHSVFGGLYVMSEPSIDLRPEDNPTSEPAPDFVVLNRSVRELASRPRPADLRLLAEVSSTTLSFDLTVKAVLYARAGIVEYWVVDVEGRRVIVHRRPKDGSYRDVAAYGAGERVATLGAPEQTILVEELF